MKKQTPEEIALIFAKKIDDDNLISEIFDFMQFDCYIRTFTDPDLLDESIRKHYKLKSVESLTSVISLIMKGKELAAIQEKTLLNDAKNYIIEHLDDDVSVEEIAATLHISYYYLCHLFKKHSQKTAHQFRTEKRLEKAIRMLLGTNDRISDIAVSCGYDGFSYFSEIFGKYVGMSPSDLRKNNSNCMMHPFYEFEDMLLSLRMQSETFINCKQSEDDAFKTPYIPVHDPGDEYGYFLHEAAIIEFEGVLYASWYNCPQNELIGYTPIVGRRSHDNGRSWTSPEIIAEDRSGQILYCPPVYGICDGKLYMFMNQMVSADHIHALDLYVLNKETDRFEFLWSRPIPFKLNTNVVSLPNGKLILPGRIAELDGFPTTPAVMISDSGKIDAKWRVVKVAQDGKMPDGSSLVHPETTLICCDDILYLFNRNDQRKVPLVYISRDYGESWSEAIAHDVPYLSSKIYSGTLTDGRYYLIANIENLHRAKLALYLSEKGQLKFTKMKIIMDCNKTADDMKKCHYPAAVEKDGKLYIIATADYSGDTLNGRGAVLFVVDLKEI